MQGWVMNWEASMDFAAMIAFILPAYAANAAPVLFGGGKSKVDLGRNFLDGRRVLGESKTYRGLLAGVLAGTAVGALLALWLPALFLSSLALQDKIMAGLLLSVGTMFGDLLGSFLKRRVGITQSARHEFYDQLLFLAGALAFASPLHLPSWDEALLLLAATYLLHKFFNWLAHKLNLKKVPW